MFDNVFIYKYFLKHVNVISCIVYSEFNNYREVFSILVFLVSLFGIGYDDKNNR